MPRAAEGWKLRQDKRTGLFTVRFRIAGVRMQRGTGERTRARAANAAERLYIEALSAAASPTGSRATPAADEPMPDAVSRPDASSSTGSRHETNDVSLEEALDRWRDAIGAELGERTVAMYRMYGGAHWVPHFRTLDRIDDRSCDALVRKRLTKVQRRTVLKESSALRGFLAWAHREGLVDTVATVPSPSRRATGVEHDNGKRRQVRVDLTPAEVEAILDALPERTKRGIAARAFFTVMYDTSLRYGTIAGLTAPGDYRRGAKTLLVRGANDKARFERSIPLSARARAALDYACPASGLIFGRVHLYEVLERAALDAGLEPFRARHLGHHAFRHARLTHLGEKTTNLAGLAYLAGHRHVSTTALYVHGGMRAATALVEDIDDDCSSTRVPHH